MSEETYQLTEQELKTFKDCKKEMEQQPWKFEQDVLKQRTLALEIAGRLPHHTMAEVLQEADKAFEWIMSKRYHTIF